MAEESHGFAQTRARLEEIVTQVRKKDVSLEKSLDLLEEGVRLANQCTELIDHADWEAAGEAREDLGQGEAARENEGAGQGEAANENEDAGQGEAANETEELAG